MQYINKPRFFTDFISAQRQGGYVLTYVVSSTGGGNGLDASSSIYNAIDNNPSNQIHFDSNAASDLLMIRWRDEYAYQKNSISSTNSNVDCLQILGHNLKSAGAKIELRQATSSIGSTYTKKQMSSIYGTNTEGTSGGSPNQVYTIDENGSHIWDFTNVDANVHWFLVISPVATNYTADIKIGSIRLGSVITAPHSVNVSEKHENAKNYKKIKSVGGNVYSYRTHKNPTWLHNQPPFTNYTAWNQMNNLPAHSYGVSPKSYSMDFSYVNDSDYMNDNESTLTIQSDKTFNSLYDQTLNGHLPIIMQKDSPSTASSKPSDFSWGYIDSFKRTRIAPNLWNISMGFSEDI